ncbi:hypothetical protein ACFLTS_03915, partial [Chloroflexota bacterium]
MIIKLIPNASESDIKQIETWFLEQDIEIRRIDAGKQILMITPSDWKDPDSFLSNRKAVESIIDTGTEYQLSSRHYQSENTVIDLGQGVVFGQDCTVLMAGPCAVESEDQVMRTADFLRNQFDIK